MHDGGLRQQPGDWEENPNLFAVHFDRESLNVKLVDLQHRVTEGGCVRQRGRLQLGRQQRRLTEDLAR